MKQKLNSTRLNKWIEQNKGIEAENRIREVTGYSLSTLQKMKDGSYKSCPGFAERKALVELTGINEADLFPVTNTEEQAS